ncbi:Malonate-semialdehyde dehydrogenase [inositol] [hydrothermal vent metagenome]|uniref:Malonate-semialdehyde dehydrogenase [inositol] n=1 Tax=hydrothermal vent metagenome TaxID=652676 RepID=A0A3B0UVB5_9ZZZZ
MNKLQNYINGQWRESSATEFLDVVNPATMENLGQVPLSPAADVASAAKAAAEAFDSWRRTPAAERIQYLFKLKNLLEEYFEELAQIITMEAGKTIGESRGEMRRAIENVEVACGIPQMMQGVISEDVAPGIDEMMIRQPVGVAAAIPSYENGAFVRPTILQNVNPAGEIARTEIFGPVLSLIHVNTIDEAIAFVNGGQYGNMACLFTNSGAAARKFRYEVQAGNIGINIGVAVPMAYFPFSGWKESFFGTLHGQSKHAVEFFTQTKVVVERWPKEWSRQF